MLLPVKIAIPVSVCSGAIRTQGQLSDATVRVMAGETLVAESVAAMADALIPLLPGVELQPGWSLVATQSLSGETSDPSPEPVAVQAVPAALGAPIVGVAHRCSECLYVAGGIPGAQMQVVAKDGPLAGVRGEGDVWLTRQVDIGPPVAKDEQLWVHQQACEQTGPEIGVTAEFEPPEPLPAPSLLDTPLKECMRSIRVTGMVPGAVVEIQRSAGEDVVGCVSAATGFFGVPALQTGEVLRARQRFESCELVSEFSPRYEVQPADPVPRPLIAGKYDICAGTPSLLLTELIPTATVRIMVDGEAIGDAEVPPNTTTFPVPVPKLATGSAVTARQALCDIWSPISNTVVLQDPWADPHPEVLEPLYPCAVAVRVTGITLGWHTVTVWASTPNLAPVGQVSAFVQGGEVDVPVAPSLLAGQQIHTDVKGCGAPLGSAAVVVQDHTPAVEPPDIPEPVVEGWSAVPVDKVIPGAWVDVWVNDVWRGAVGVGGSSGWVPIAGTLEVNDILRARQTMCSRVSPRGRRTQVIHKRPVADFVAVPNEGTAPLQVQFNNHSEGANHPTEPYYWDFDVTNIGPSATSTDKHPQHTYTKPGAYTVTLRAKNASGWETPVSRTVVVLQPTESGEETKPVWLYADDVPEGAKIVPFVGHFPPQDNTVLTKIRNPSPKATLGFPKEKDGKTTEDCGKGDPAAVVLLPPLEELTGKDFEQIWGQSAPPTPGKYTCCGPPGYSQVLINITYIDKP